ncbi:MAG: hypothetical protein HY688_03735 [Chloroflexi bacterium]|nr:hypothetical protein [Chloroflexota bacterium]
MSRLLLAFSLFAVLLVGCSSGGKVEGTLWGVVTIGPLAPVQRMDEPPPTPRPEVYAARKILVYEENGRTLMRQVEIGPTGRYAVHLAAGTYVVDVKREGVGGAKGLPRAVTVQAGRSVELDVDIDTGIR